MAGRRLVAAFACRAAGTRLYGKPLQGLGGGRSILDHLLIGAMASPQIDDVVLGIAEGTENLPFVDVAHRHGVPYVVGSERDVLWRLILCARAGDATDVFRVTTESPFPAWELLAEAWRRHVEGGNDITVVDHLPEGSHFEIYTRASLERSHREGEDAERSEYCSAFPRRRPDLFRIEAIRAPHEIARLDRRLTVDYPEDLVLCRRVYEAVGHLGPHIPLRAILEHLDAHPELGALVAAYVDPQPVWTPVLER